MLERNTGLPDYREKNNPSNIVVLVDQDGVLADFDGEFLRRWRDNNPEYAFLPLSERSNFYIYQDYPNELMQEVELIYNSPGFIASLPPIPGGLESIIEMKKAGYNVKICTAQIPGNHVCLIEKQDWIARNLGEKWLEDLIISNDKTLIYGDILIDDKPEIKGMRIPTWEHVVFDAPYNRYVQGKRRLSGWQDWNLLFK
jgi:5'-nucleotidase